MGCAFGEVVQPGDVGVRDTKGGSSLSRITRELWAYRTKETRLVALGLGYQGRTRDDGVGAVGPVGPGRPVIMSVMVFLRLEQGTE